MIWKIVGALVLLFLLVRWILISRDPAHVETTDEVVEKELGRRGGGE